MIDTSKEIRRLGMQGYCCSQIMVKLGLEARGEDNPVLMDAIAGLCGGLYAGLCCGTLTGAACLLSMYDKKAASMIMIPQLVEWFQLTYSQEYGGISCEEIIDGNMRNRGERCPKIMAETIEKCRELLAEHGYTI